MPNSGMFGGPFVVETPDYRGLDSDAVGFSIDTDWMPIAVFSLSA